MALVRNPNTLTQIREVLHQQGGFDAVQDQAVLVAEVNPKLLKQNNIVKRGACSNTSAVTIYAVPADKDFVLTSASLSVIKDATSTSVWSRIGITIDGAATSIMEICGITLTVQADSLAQSFPNGIKVDRGTNITIANSTTTANVLSVACIVGYLLDAQ